MRQLSIFLLFFSNLAFGTMGNIDGSTPFHKDIYDEVAKKVFSIKFDFCEKPIINVTGILDVFIYCGNVTIYTDVEYVDVSLLELKKISTSEFKSDSHIFIGTNVDGTLYLEVNE